MGGLETVGLYPFFLECCLQDSLFHPEMTFELCFKQEEVDCPVRLCHNGGGGSFASAG